MSAIGELRRMAMASGEIRIDPLTGETYTAEPSRPRMTDEERAELVAAAEAPLAFAQREAFEAGFKAGWQAAEYAVETAVFAAMRGRSRPQVAGKLHPAMRTALAHYMTREPLDE